MIQSGGFLPFSLNENPFIKVNEGVWSLVASCLRESNNIDFDNKDVYDLVDLLYLLKRFLKISSIKGSGITLTNNEIKYIIKVIKSLENRGILLKRTTTKITSEGGILDFLKPLMTAALPLMKNVLPPLAKKFLLPFELSARMSAAESAIQNKICGSGITALIISNEEMDDIMKIFNRIC